jgi:allophanate hydrolase subunit 1
LARAFYEQYHVAKPGTMIRERALEKVLELVKTYRQLYGDDDDVEHLDEGEARAELKELLRELQAEHGQRQPD